MNEAVLTPIDGSVAAEIGAEVRPLHIWLLVSIMLGATLLCVHGLGSTSYWYDEICSVLYARGETEAIFTPPSGYYERAPALASFPGTKPWRNVWFGFDTAPPLYPMLLRLWWRIFGESDISGRALSVALSVLTIVVLFDVGRLIVSPSVALWACALWAVSPSVVRTAQDARAYPLLGLLGVLICDVTIRSTRPGRIVLRGFLLLILCAAGLLTHHFIAGGIAAIALFAILRLRGRARVAVLCAIAIACAVEIWEIPILLNHAQDVNTTNDWLTASRDGLFLQTLLRAAWLPIGYLILPPDSPGLNCIPAAALLILPLFLTRRYPGLLLAGLWPLGIIGLVGASDLWLGKEALQYVRYTMAAAPMVFISFAALAHLGGRWARHLLPSLAVVGGLLAVPEAYSAQLWVKPESRQLAQDVQSHVKSGDVLVVASMPNMRRFSAGAQYLGIDFYAGPLPCAIAVLTSPGDEEVRRLIWSHRHVWVIKCVDAMCTDDAVDANGYLGPCRLTSAASMRLFAGHLYLAQREE